MKIVEIVALSNGAHRNQNGVFSSIPDGWAVIPDEMVVPETFPFVDLVMENGVITGMTSGVVPVSDPVSEAPTEQEDTDAMLVDHEYRLTLLELGVTE